MKKRFSKKVRIELRERAVQEALRPFDTISVVDFVALMADSPPSRPPTPDEYAEAERELWAAGFQPTYISLFGHDYIFPRYQRTAINQLARWQAAEALYD